MNQTLALLIDAYRDLNARRMFWIVLIISTLMAASLGGVGLNPQGISLFGYEVRSEFNSIFMTPARFYKLMFLNLGIDSWLTFLAAILALISTATIFPDFIAAGAVDLYLSKPIGRLRLFLTKYLCGLLFVALQIACFCLASFLVIGIRGGVWEPAIFLAIPIVVLFFSYLFCICVLFGALTRSTIASILLTILIWAAIFGVHATEVSLLTLQLSDRDQATRLDDRIASDKASVRVAAQRAAEAATMPATQPTTRSTPQSFKFFASLVGHGELQSSQNRLEQDENERAAYSSDRYDHVHRLFFEVMTLLPKTTETVDLLRRVLVTHADLSPDQPPPPPPSSRRGQRATLQEQIQTELAKRSVGWVLGTSLGFEAVMLALGAWIFCRRDY